MDLLHCVGGLLHRLFCSIKLKMATHQGGYNQNKSLDLLQLKSENYSLYMFYDSTFFSLPMRLEHDGNIFASTLVNDNNKKFSNSLYSVEFTFV